MGTSLTPPPHSPGFFFITSCTCIFSSSARHGGSEEDLQKFRAVMRHLPASFCHCASYIFNELPVHRTQPQFQLPSRKGRDADRPRIPHKHQSCASSSRTCTSRTRPIRGGKRICIQPLGKRPTPQLTNKVEEPGSAHAIRRLAPGAGRDFYLCTGCTF